MKNWMRYCASALATLTLLAGLASCKGGKTNPADSTENGNGTESDRSEVTTDNRDENGYLLDDLGERDYNDKKIRILTWINKSYNQFSFDSENGDHSNKFEEAVYSRNLRVEQRMKVQLKWTSIEGNNSAMDNYITQARALSKSGDVDVFAAYSMVPATLAQEGLLSDMNALPSVNLGNPWWNRSMLEKCSIYDKNYFGAGDLSPDMLAATYVVYANKRMVADNRIEETIASEYGEDTLYDLVYNGKWTLDKMIRLSRDVAVESGDGSAAGATYGFSTYLINVDPFLQGAGILTVENGADGSLIPSDSFGSVDTQNLLTTLVDFFKSSAAFLGRYDEGWDNATWINAWYENRAMFLMEDFTRAKLNYEKKVYTYLLPVPKADEEQDGYRCTPGFYSTVWSVANGSAKDEAVGAALECLASESYRNVMPAFYEQLLRRRYADDPGEYKMIDYIKNTISFDSGRLFTSVFGGKTWSAFRDCVNANSTDWISYYNQNVANLMTNGCDTINKIIDIYQNR